MTLANKIELTAALWGLLSGISVLVLAPVEEGLPKFGLKGAPNQYAFVMLFFATCVCILLGCAMWELWSRPTERTAPQQLEAK